MTARPFASITFAGIVMGATVLSGVSAPMAHADDPLAPIKAAVNGDRSRTGCPAYAYNDKLEHGAQTAVRPGDPSGGEVYGYSGDVKLILGWGDPQAAAINDAYKNGAGGLISNCDFTEFGVGFFRNESTEYDSVSIYFGKPAKAAAPPAPAPAPAPVPVPDPPRVAPTDAVRVSFDRGGLNWTVKVTSTADIPGSCTYSAKNPVLPGSNKKFDIGARGSASFTVVAPPPLSKYHVVVSCTGVFDGKNVEFGHVEQDVTA